MVKKIKKTVSECLPSIIICIVGFVIILLPIIIAIISYYEEETMSVSFEERVNENYNDIDPIIQIAIYATKHVADCDKCTAENFPFCERANEVVDTMMKFDIFKIKN